MLPSTTTTLALPPSMALLCAALAVALLALLVVAGSVAQTQSLSSLGLAMIGLHLALPVGSLLAGAWTSGFAGRWREHQQEYHGDGGQNSFHKNLLGLYAR